MPKFKTENMVGAINPTFPSSSHYCSESNVVQRAVIAGGSRGLGKSLAIELAKRGMLRSTNTVRCDTDYLGAHVLLLARGKDVLEVAKEEVSAHRKSSTQVVDAIAIDL